MTPGRAAIAALVACAGLAGCYREQRQFNTPPPPVGADAVRASNLLPGGSAALQSGLLPAPDRAKLEDNAFAVSQGKRLFRWYNCSGCHSGGGGGNMGPPLADAEWLYGSAPTQIHATIVEGRPQGMPAFGGRIPDDQVWQLVAYVRSMSGQLRKDVAPSRSDAISGGPAENARDRVTPVPASASAR